MAFSRANIGWPVQLGTTATTVVNNASGKTAVSGVTIHNDDAAARTVKLYLVPNGGSAGAANKIMEISVTAKNTIAFEFPGAPFLMDVAGDTLKGTADAASVVTVTPHGDKLT